jgi:hypothetical protein
MNKAKPKPRNLKTKTSTTKSKAVKVTPRKYSVYNAMEIALRDQGFVLAGRLGSYLMEKFLANDGEISAKEADDKGFLEKMTFAEWRAALINKEWLEYDHDRAVATKKIGVCSPGKRLNRYLNKEKILNKNLVTTEMLDARVDVLQDLLKNLIEIVDPPYTPAKGEEYRSDTKVLVDAIATKILENGERSRPRHPDYSRALKN